MSENRRGESLKAPQGGWPKRPLGDQTDLDAIVRWLDVPADNSQLSVVVRNRADAQTWVHSIARLLLRDLQSHSASSSLRETEERLDELQDAARALLLKISAFSGPTGLMRTVALECAFFERNTTADPGTYETVGWDQILSKPLRALAATAEAYKTEIAETITTRTGRQNFYDRAFGDPRRKLARMCAELLRECRYGEGGAAPSDALVLELSEMVWAFAVGERPPVGFLDTSARSGAVAAREDEPYDQTPTGDKAKLIALINPKNSH